MELRDFFKIIRKNLIVFLIIVIVGTLGAVFFTKKEPASYLASTTITVNKSSNLKQSQVNYYLFDNYYNVQSAGLFAKIVTTWFESPALVKEIYAKADLDLPNISQRKLSRTFKAAFSEPATIKVSISGNNQENLEKLLNAATDVIQAKTNELGKTSESFYDVAKFAPIVTPNNSSLLLNTFIGLIASILIGGIVAFAIEYFKKS